jgi:HEAT repeat protein
VQLKGRQSKQILRDLLLADDVQASIETIGQYPARQSVNFLISFFYDTDAVLRWRSIGAFGRVVAMLADDHMESARVVMRRLMWNLNDESGGIGWGSPEAMGEAAALHAGLAKEFATILRSYLRPEENFLEHEMLQRGVLWGIGRLAEVRPVLLPQTDNYLTPFLSSGDPHHRGLAAWALGNLKSKAAVAALDGLAQDTNEILFFSQLSFATVSVGDLATAALDKINFN